MAIEEICGKSTWHGSFSRLAALRVTFWKNKKTVSRYGLEECVYQITGLYHFSFGQVPYNTQTNRPTYSYKGCQRWNAEGRITLDFSTDLSVSSLVPFFSLSLDYSMVADSINTRSKEYRNIGATYTGCFFSELHL